MSKSETTLNVRRALYGRTQIFTDVDEITADNVIKVLNKAITVHEKNKSEITYLYNYYKGKQPILERSKEIRPDICNIIVENWAYKITSFKVGYLCGSPIQYTSGTSGDEVSEQIDYLNDIMENDNKATKDKDLFEWQMIAGTSYRMGLPDADNLIESFVLHPGCAFVIYKNDVSKKPLGGVYITESVNNPMNVLSYTVYTDKMMFEIKNKKIVRQEKHYLGMIPIIEYPANSARLGAFEIALDLMDAINAIDSNRLDGVEQFIQSLMIIYNAELKDETANSIREKGLIELKSIGDNKADVKILNEQLNQDQTQTLKNDLLQQLRELVGLPSQGDGTTGDSSNNGAQLLKGGWENAEIRAKESETMFKKGEKEYLRLILGILSKKAKRINITPMDVNITFTRRNYENIQVKAQVLTGMLSNDKVAPKLAFESCGMFIDPEQAYRESMAYYEEHKDDRRAEQSGDTIPVGVDGSPEEEGTVM